MLPPLSPSPNYMSNYTLVANCNVWNRNNKNTYPKIRDTLHIFRDTWEIRRRVMEIKSIVYSMWNYHFYVLILNASNDFMFHNFSHISIQTRSLNIHTAFLICWSSRSKLICWTTYVLANSCRPNQRQEIIAYAVSLKFF